MSLPHQVSNARVRNSWQLREIFTDGARTTLLTTCFPRKELMISFVVRLAVSGWHNNQHEDLAAANTRHRWWEFDLIFIVVEVLEKVGLVTHVVRPRAERKGKQVMPG